MRTSARRFGSLILWIAVTGLMTAGCVGESTPAPKASSAAPSHKAEFLAVADRVEKSANPFLGRAQIDELRVHLQTTTASTAEGRKIRNNLANELLRIGEIDEAMKLLNESVTAMEADPAHSPEEADIYVTRALAHLREAEIQNCVSRHNRDCCIFPLKDGGIHTVAEPAREAKADYIRFLDGSPPSKSFQDPVAAENKRVTATWLLNVACMALNEFPNGVPARYRLSTKIFASNTEIGRFVDIASDLGIDVYDHAGGAIVDDFDGDGDLDIVSSTSDVRGPMKAFRNEGNGTFQDVVAAWHLDDQLGGLHLTGADYDNDGDLDILVPRGAWMNEEGRIRKSLLRNDGPQGFTDVTEEAGMSQPRFPTQAVAWADFDQDGWLDVYVGHESRMETMPGSQNYPSQLFHNNGNGTFTDVAEAAGVQNNRFAKGVAAGDYDNDGDMDLYVSNIGPNRMYRNDGGMKFTDVAPELGLTEPKGRSFACWFFDLENDGDLDLWVNAYDAKTADVARSAMGQKHNASAPCLYRNEGNGKFTNIAREAGVDRAWLPMGSSFGDFDNDGFLDIYLGTGDPMYESLMPNIALRNDHGRRFQDVTGSSGLGHLQKGHEVVFVDLDDDGDQDIFHQLGGFYPGDAFRNAFFLNPGHGNHFVDIQLVGTESNRQGIGTRVTVQLEEHGGRRSVHRAVGSISSFGQVPRRQEIGLGNATSIAAIEIWWPKSGKRQTLSGVPLDSSIRVTEGKDGFEQLQLRPVQLGSKKEAAAL